MVSFNTAVDSHYHGISGEILSYVLTAMESDLPNVDWKVGAKDAPFGIATVTLPCAMGYVDCDLRGPIVGDAPMLEAGVTYAVRPGVSYRTWESRLVNLSPKVSRYVTIIASADGIITVFGGPLAPQEVGDPSVQDAKASASFWSMHALSEDSMTREG